MHGAGSLTNRARGGGDGNRMSSARLTTGVVGLAGALGAAGVAAGVAGARRRSAAVVALGVEVWYLPVEQGERRRLRATNNTIAQRYSRQRDGVRVGIGRPSILARRGAVSSERTSGEGSHSKSVVENCGEGVRDEMSSGMFCLTVF